MIKILFGKEHTTMDLLMVLIYVQLYDTWLIGSWLGIVLICEVISFMIQDKIREKYDL